TGKSGEPSSDRYRCATQFEAHAGSRTGGVVGYVPDRDAFIGRPKLPLVHLRSASGLPERYNDARNVGVSQPCPQEAAIFIACIALGPRWRPTRWKSKKVEVPRPRARRRRSRPRAPLRNRGNLLPIAMSLPIRITMPPNRHAGRHERGGDG